ncbi:MAG: amino acid carrier protein [Phycisphaeraceae bacterium]|nr:amino acid carrier protein [Phycisphaeraceae bacterium]
MEVFWKFLDGVNGILWHNLVLYIILAVGVLFTFWSGFCQYRALTHGFALVRGNYDDKSDPGAINHFQALSTALSGTVGLGNIAGVSVAVALGGPGAVFWMWIVGMVGMALKLTEVTQSMLYRDTSDPDNPKGGPMWVCRKGFAKISPALAPLGIIVGGIFCVTVLISTITGGNMFQAWNVAEITKTYYPSIPPEACGIVLAVLTGLVIIGGIKRIGSVTGRLVPFMCALYLLAALVVLGMNIQAIPGMFVLIFKSALPPWLGGANVDPTGAFLGGTFGYAFLWGMKRALFSNEAGQGSSPIAHSAAKTDEPAREGIVAGLEPFIDTLVVCTITALVVLSTGAWNRDAASQFDAAPNVIIGNTVVAELAEAPAFTIENGRASIAPINLPEKKLPADPRDARSEPSDWKAREAVMLVATLTHEDSQTPVYIVGKVSKDNNTWRAEFDDVDVPEGTLVVPTTLRAGEEPAWIPDVTVPVAKSPNAARISNVWRPNDGVLVIARGEFNKQTGRELGWMNGSIKQDKDDQSLYISWLPRPSKLPPTIDDPGLYMDLKGAALTGHAFDRAVPGLGQWVVTLACWLFALSTIIAWSYYGEQAVVFLLGKAAVMPYKIVYCLAVVVATFPFIKTDAQLDSLTALGTGVMLFANIPIMLIFGRQAMAAYRDYNRRLKSGEIKGHAAPPITDVVEGKDVQ